MKFLSLFTVGLLLFATGCSREAKVRRHLERADGYFNSGEFTKAEIEYLNVLRLDGRNAAAIRHLGFALFEQGRYPQAHAFLERAKAAEPENLAIRARLGFGALMGRNLSRAREEAIFILSKQPTNEEAFVLLADAVDPIEVLKTRDLLESYRPQAATVPGFHVAIGLLESRRNNLQAAENSFKEALRLNPNYATARSTLGNLYLRQRRMELAEAELKAAAESASPRSPLSMSYADFKIRQGQVQEGKRLLDELGKKTPDFIPVQMRRAELAFSQKNYDECEAILKAITARGQVNFDAQFLQGRLRLARADAPGALSEFQRLLAAFPKVPQLHYQLALTHLALRDPAAASASLNEALTLDPDYTEAILLSADLSIRKGEHRIAIAALNDLLRRETNSTQARIMLAAAHVGRQDYSSAMAEYQKLAKAYPKDAQFALIMGNLHSRQGDTNAARQEYERALSVNKAYLPALERLIDLHLDTGKKDEALQMVQGRISETPASAPLQLLLARVLLAQTQTNQAEAAMLKAVELDPELRASYVMLTDLYVKTQRHHEALQRLEAVLEKRPGHIGALMTAATIQEGLKNYAEARNHYEKILAIRPDWAIALNNLAYIYCEHLNELDRAQSLAEKARAALPGDPAAADTLGWVLHKRGEHTRALALLQESAQALPEHPEVLFHLGMAHYALGQEEPARANFEKALAQNQDFPGKAECQQRLALLTMTVEQADANTVRQFEKLLEQRRGDPIVQGRLARIYEATGEPAKAARLYESLLKENPNNVAALTRLAAFYLQDEKNAGKAMDLARKARAAAPNDPAVAHTVGRLAHDGGDHKWALSLLQESARRLGDDPQVLLDLATAQFSNGQLREAEASLSKAAAESGTGPKVIGAAVELLKWVRLCMKPEDAEKASADIAQALKANSEHLAGRFLNGVLQQRKGDVNTAQATFDAVLKAYPSFTPANRELAYLYSEYLDDQQGALDHAMKAREADRQDSAVAKTLGIINYKRNDFRRAAELLKESMKQRENDAEVHFYLGLAHFKLGDNLQSRAAFERTLALDGNSRFAPEARKFLGDLR